MPATPADAPATAAATHPGRSRVPAVVPALRRPADVRLPAVAFRAQPTPPATPRAEVAATLAAAGAQAALPAAVRGATKLAAISAAARPPGRQPSLRFAGAPPQTYTKVALALPPGPGDPGQIGYALPPPPAAAPVEADRSAKAVPAPTPPARATRSARAAPASLLAKPARPREEASRPLPVASAVAAGERVRRAALERSVENMLRDHLLSR